MSTPSNYIGRLLCWLGFHDFRIIDSSFAFGPGSIERVECRRCGKVEVRRQR